MENLCVPIFGQKNILRQQLSRRFLIDSRLDTPVRTQNARSSIWQLVVERPVTPSLSET